MRAWRAMHAAIAFTACSARPPRVLSAITYAITRSLSSNSGSDSYSWGSYTPDIRNRDSRSRSGRSRSDSRSNTGGCTKIRLQGRHNQNPGQRLDIAPSPGSMETPALPAMGDTLGPESEEED